MNNDFNDTNYMGWNNAPSKMTAYQIDNLADKIRFLTDMLDNTLISFDTLEKELVNMANAPVPPQPTALTSVANRIDGNQKQLRDGLNKLKELTKEIDLATDKLQGNNKNGWGW